MKKTLFILLSGFLALNLCGCKTMRKFIPPIFPAGAVSPAPFPAYSGPKAAIAVADFEVNTAKAPAEIGPELRRMLVAILMNSKRFLVAERQQPADLIITAAVTEFEPEISGGSDGLAGGGAANNGNFGGLLGTSLNKAHMALDIRIVNSLSSEVLAATQVKGQAKDFSAANRVCIIETVRYIIQAVPNAYYKH